LDIGIIVLMYTSVKFALISIIIVTIPSDIHGNNPPISCQCIGNQSWPGVVTEDALKDDGVEDASLHASRRDQAEIPPKKKTTDKQTDFMVNSGHKKAQQRKF
jgi:hypothetical protein